jgi:uncharacterized protein (DUF1778 family)
MLKVHAIPDLKTGQLEMPEIILHEEDWDLFYEALVHPPEPTEAFKTAWKEFKEQQDRQ